MYRILERFAVHYMNCNLQDSEKLENDDVFTLTYALIMLNVSQHSAKARASSTTSPQESREAERGVGAFLARVSWLRNSCTPGTKISYTLV